MTESSSGKLKAFNTTRLLCIEYPGYVRNVDKMLQTLGGLDKISDTYFNTKRRIELHFRPEDPYCHSVCGDLHSARGVLLKVKRRRRKTNIATSSTSAVQDQQQQETQEWNYEQEVVGIVHSTYKFTSLVDYQYLTPKEMQNAFSQVSTSQLMDEKQPLHMVPAIFSRIDMQGSYNYQPEISKRPGTKSNPLHSQNLPDEEDWKRESDSRIRKKRPSEALAAIFNSEDVPKEPGAQCKEVFEAMHKRFTWVDDEIVKLNKLFEERPLWSRTALYCHLGSKFTKERMKQLLSYVAFYWLNGPWRALWNRFGYDPRKHPDSKIYQICDFRVRDRSSKRDNPVLPLRSSKLCSLPVQLHRYKKTAVSVDQEDGGEAKDNEKFIPPEDLPYTFHANKLPRARQIMYQLCDIYDDDVKQIIALNDGQEKDCTEKDGWFPAGVISKIRACMVKKVEVLINKELEKPYLVLLMFCKPFLLVQFKALTAVSMTECRSLNACAPLKYVK
eukprot:gene15747-17336_t